MKNYNELINELVRDVVGDIEAGHFLPWENPVKDEYAMPFFNPLTKTVYSGLNVLRLAAFNYKNDSKDPRFLTFPQVKSAGFKLKKGCHGVKLYKLVQIEEKTADEEPEMNLFSEKDENKRPAMVPFVVFNAADIEGLPELPKIEYTAEEKNDLLENMIKNSEAPIYYDGLSYGINGYSPALDSIHLYERSAFKNLDEFYGTAAHEIAHSTGHYSRLNRNMKGGMRSKSYAREELVAELTAAMIRAAFGGAVSAEHLKNNRAYLDSWARAVKDDKTAIYKAYKEAAAAFDYIKSHMIYKGSGISTYEERIKALPDIGKKTVKKTVELRPKKTFHKKTARKTFVVTVHKK